MSIEKAVEENTKALMALTAAFLAASGALGATGRMDTLALKTDDSEQQPEPEIKKSEAATPTPKSSEASAPTTEKSSVVLTYATDVKPLILEICAKGIKERGKVETLLQRFGVKAAPGLKPEQFAEFVGYAKRIRDEGFDPADGHE